MDYWFFGLKMIVIIIVFIIDLLFLSFAVGLLIPFLYNEPLTSSILKQILSNASDIQYKLFMNYPSRPAEPSSSPDKTSLPHTYSDKYRMRSPSKPRELRLPEKGPLPPLL
jgi:hypothetical protein